MKKLILFFPPIFLIPIISLGQKVSGKLKFDQGQHIDINMQLKTNIAQQAMGQSIDFDLDGSTIHDYVVTNTTEDNFTLHHQMKQIGFNFDGMGQKRSFDSNKEKDMTGQFGKPIKEMLDKTYDMIIDPAGKVLMVMPEKIDAAKMDPRMAIITNMLKDVLDAVQPPQKGRNSFFKVLPDHETGKGDIWADTLVNESTKSIINYTLKDMNDSTITVDFTGFSVTSSKSEFMGNETSTTMNNKISGNIMIDRITGILREKTTSVESNGTTEAMGSTLPVTSKTTIVIKVK